MIYNTTIRVTVLWPLRTKSIYLAGKTKNSKILQKPINLTLF